MKKIIIAVIAIASVAVMAIYARKNEKVTIDDERLIKLESLAEQGDTAAMHSCLNSVFFKYDKPINGFNVEGIFDYQGGITVFATIYFTSDSISFSILHPTFEIPSDDISNTFNALDCIVLSYKTPVFHNPQKITLDSIRALPFAFIDIDFDGNKELLLSHPNNGQKSICTYTAYSLPKLNEVEPFKDYT